MTIKKYLAIFIIFSILSVQIAYATESFVDLQSFYSSTLTTSVSSSATTLLVATPPSVNTAFLVLSPNAANEEIVYMTSRSGNSLTVVRGLGTTTSSTVNAGNGKSHGAGSGVEIADVHFYIKTLQDSNTFQYRGATTTSAMLANIPNAETNDLAYVTDDERFYRYGGSSWSKQGDNDETIAGDKTFSGYTTFSATTTMSATTTISGPLTISDGRASTFTEAVTFSVLPTIPETPSADTDAASKGYVDLAASSGCSDAATSTRGCVELATKAEASAGTWGGDTGARLVLPSSMATSTSQVSTTSIPVTGTDGKLDQSFYDLSENFTFTGDVTITGTTTVSTTTSESVNLSNSAAFYDGGTQQIFWGLLASSTFTGVSTITVDVPQRTLLRFVLSGLSSGNILQPVAIRFNEDQQSNYSFAYSTTSIEGKVGTTSIPIGFGGGDFFANIDVLNGNTAIKPVDISSVQVVNSGVYASSTFPTVYNGAGVWATTTPQWINSITIIDNGGGGLTDMTLRIYGSGF